ncbi:MAG: peptidoglycan-associated lipoprotein Pal [Burkholderiaceae bacterium]
MRISPLSITLTLSFLAACSTAPKAPPAPAPTPAPPPVAQVPAPAPTPARTDDAQALAARLRQQIADLDGKSVFFDFDSFVVKPEYDATLHAQADFLRANPNSKLTVQGNTDERGGSEYNLALGQKRAEAVRKQLGVLGVSADRVEATSFGKEKPRATCHEESCWSQNRRDDFVNKP